MTGDSTDPVTRTRGITTDSPRATQSTRVVVAAA
jgi:hypothetical protein